MKTYRLRKDLPGIKAGEFIIAINITDTIKLEHAAFLFPVKNNPDWFEEVKEEEPFIGNTESAVNSKPVMEEIKETLTSAIKRHIEDNETLDGQLRNLPCPSCQKSWKEHECPIVVFGNLCVSDKRRYCSKCDDDMVQPHVHLKNVT